MTAPVQITKAEYNSENEVDINSTRYNVYYQTISGYKDGQRATRAHYIDPYAHVGTTRDEYDYICQHFARGVCFHGPKCRYRHQLPNSPSLLTERLLFSLDVFGRPRSSTTDPDFGGPGCFLLDITTLWIPKLPGLPGSGKCDSHLMRSFCRALKQSFVLFGRCIITPCSTVNISDGVLIQYETRASAEFVREAADGMHLDDFLRVTRNPFYECGSVAGIAYETSAVFAVKWSGRNILQVDRRLVTNKVDQYIETLYEDK